MSLQNRVSPFGALVAVPGRGTMMGNRGVLHDDRRRIVRDWQVRRWIACVLHVPGRRRQVMRPRSYTELFFLDEAVAFAAGHRPCAECRREDFRRFQRLWLARFGGSGRVDEIDSRLHADRLDGRAKRTYRAPIENLPDGTFVALDGDAWLLHAGRLHAWTGAGYAGRRTLPASMVVDVLTPRCSVDIFRAGYAAAVNLPERTVADDEV